jgi:hypothetical protein
MEVPSFVTGFVLLVSHPPVLWFTECSILSDVQCHLYEYHSQSCAKL